MRQSNAERRANTEMLQANTEVLRANAEMLRGVAQTMNTHTDALRRLLERTP